MVGWVASFFIFFLALGGLPARAGQAKNSKDETSKIGRRNITKGSLDLYSPEREIQMGREMAQQIERLVSINADPQLNAYLQDLTDRIVRHSDSRLPIRTAVIDSNEVNAFTLPGGYLFICTGLITRTRSEAELAGVIAHEVAHVAARHTTREMTQQQIWQWMSVPLLLFGGPISFTLQQSLDLAGPLTFQEFSRRDERQADYLGLQYLYASGYDPEAFVDFFERAKQMEKDPDGIVPRAFSSHPLTKDRMAAAQRQIQRKLPSRAEYVVDTSQYEQTKARLVQFLSDQMPFVGSSDQQKPALHDSGGKIAHESGGKKHSAAKDWP